MGYGGNERYRPPRPPPPPKDGRAQRSRVSSARRPSHPSPAEFGGNVTSTTYAADGSQSPPHSSASQSQNPAGSSVVVEEARRLPGQATELAKLGLPTRDSVVVEQVPKFPGQATELATSGVPNPDSEVLGCLNEGSEKALDVQLHEALLHGHGREVSHGVTLGFIGVLLGWFSCLDYNLRQKLCEHILPNREKAGKSSSEGNLAESSDAPNVKRTRPAGPNLVGSENSTGVRQRGNSFTARIRLPGTREEIWLGTYKTEKAAVRVRDAAANWLTNHRGTEFLDDNERNELKKCAREAGEDLSDDPSHHNVGLQDLVENLEKEATTSASLKGKAVASAEHVIQWESSTQENPFSSSEFEEKATTLASLKRKAVASAEHVSQWESPAQENPISPSEFEEKATTLASLKGQAVASAEFLSQWESLASENPGSPIEFVDDWASIFLSSEEVGL